METMMPNLNETTKSELSAIHKCEYNVQEASEMYEKKHKLVEEVFDNIGRESYIEIVALLHTKYFGQLKKEVISKHIMYRVLNGSTISLNNNIDNEEFIYDDCDKSVESLLQDMLNVDNVMEAKDLIESDNNIDFEMQ
jgi:hypothetical protein